MKVAIPAVGPHLSSPLDRVFGRAKYLIVVDTESGEHMVHNNATCAKEVHAAGIVTAAVVIELGVDAVITSNIGPKAFDTLRHGYVKVYSGVSGTVEQGVGKFKAGELEPSTAGNVEGHWGESSG